MKIDRKVRLRVEELESRVVPSTVTPPAMPPAPYAGWGSTNWSGIDLNTINGAATAVSAAWTVPTVPTISPVEYSSTWVGIDGDLSSTVEQIGTGADTATSPLIPNAPPYFAWYEMYPSGMNVITIQNGPPNPFSGSPFTVSPGDAISASVTYQNTTTVTTTGRHPTTTSYENFLLTITDTLATPVTIGGITETAESYTTIQQISGAKMSSAEWIEEAPSSSSGVLPLAPFGSVTFTNAQATINDTSGSIASFVGNKSVINYGVNGGPLQEINLMDMGTFNRLGQWTSIKDETSLLSDQPGIPSPTPAPNGPGDSFTVQYGPSPTYTYTPLGTTTPVTIPLYEPMDRVSGPPDLQVTVANAGTPAGTSLIIVEISPATPGAASTHNPVVASNAIVQPGFFSPAEATLGRSDVVMIAGMAVGEGHPGAGFSWFGVPPGSGAVVPLAATPVHGSAIAGGVRFESSAELFGTAWSSFEKPALAPRSTLAFSDDIAIDRLVGALALAAFLPSQLFTAKEEPKRARQLRDGNGRPE